MLEEALAGLAIRPGGTYVDATFGRGGHSAAILHALGGGGVLHALDRDPQACAEAWKRFGPQPNFRIHARNFAELEALGPELGIAGHVDGLLLDLGVSSPQLDDAGRGFSFAQDGPLDMRMDPRSGESAAQWLARAKEGEIADVLWRHGEERNSRRIARRIVETRAAVPIASTAQLAALIAAVPGPRSRNIHPATRSFQAIRIHVNGELEALEAALAAAPALLAAGGRLAVISFHSLEDRIVKRFVRGKSRDSVVGRAGSDSMSLPAKTTTGTRDSRTAEAEAKPEFISSGRARTDGRIGTHPAFPRVPSPESRVPVFKSLSRQFPSESEIAENPRARSAVLRVAERLP